MKEFYLGNIREKENSIIHNFSCNQKVYRAVDPLQMSHFKRVKFLTLLS